MFCVVNIVLQFPFNKVLCLHLSRYPIYYHIDDNSTRDITKGIQAGGTKNNISTRETNEGAEP